MGVRGDGKVGDLATDRRISMRPKVRSESVMTYQKLKKSLTSFSVVSWLMPLTLTVLDIFAVCVWRLMELVVWYGSYGKCLIERVD